ERETRTHVFFFDSKSRFWWQRADARQRDFRRVVFDQSKRSSEMSRRKIWKSRPVRLSKARYLERVAGDHFNVKADCGTDLTQTPNDAAQIQQSAAERNLGQQEPIAVFREPHILEVSRESPRRQRLDHLHRIFQKRDAIARVEAHPNMVVADPLQDSNQL